MKFGFFKKDSELVPPDVGKEEEVVGNEQAALGGDYTDSSVQADSPVQPEDNLYRPQFGLDGGGQGSQSGMSHIAVNDETMKFEFEKLYARINSLNLFLKTYTDRTSALSQQIGELRAMIRSNEKEVSKVAGSSAKAIEAVKEMQPEKLRVDYMRADMKIQSLHENLEYYRQYLVQLFEEIKELKRRTDGFLGTESLFKLNEDIQKDMIKTQQISSMVKMHADKSEQIFIELRRWLTETQKINGLITNLDVNYSGLKKHVEQLKLDLSNVVSQDDFLSFRNLFNSSLSEIESYRSTIDTIRDEQSKINRLVEKLIGIENQNKNDIADLALAIGDNHVTKVSDYDALFSSVFELIDDLAGQVAAMRKKIKVSEKPSGKSGSGLKNVKVHPDLSKKIDQLSAGIDPNMTKLKSKLKSLKEKTAKIPKVYDLEDVPEESPEQEGSEKESSEEESEQPKVD